MISEKGFTDKEETALEGLDLTLEMAVPTEWVVRDNDNPDNLVMVYVEPTDSADELQAACSCEDGAADRPCPHALAVFQEIRGQNHILHYILSRRPPAAA